MKDKRIIFTGGHHNSALIVAKKLRSQSASVYWFGHKYTMRGAKNVSAEYKEVAGADIPFYNLLTGKFHRAKLVDFLKLPIGFLQSLWLLIKIRPQLIISFGGYLAVPVVLAGWLLRIPSVTHEQTITAGKANRFLKHFVKKIFITFKSSRKYFPKEKTILTGLPLPEAIYRHPDPKGILRPRRPPGLRMTELGKKKLPLLMITGGKQGSHVINKTIEEALPQLLGKYNLFHQVGETSFTRDLARLKEKREKLDSKYKKRYKVVGYINNELFVLVLKQADLVITRAGAHNIYKLLFLKKKAILIPLPFSFDQEQQKNAQVLEKIGLGLILPQRKLTGEKLLKLIDKVIKKKVDKKSIRRADRLIVPDATKRILREIAIFLI